MSQLMEDLRACVRAAKITNGPFGNYQMMNITADHAEKILAMIEAFKALNLKCDCYDELMGEPACDDCEICRVNALMAEL